ncbi:MAG: inorganic phosphate transporter [Bacteroidetes bacterium HGW-Bacteroidetes-4]|jgi:PiT family inorganic phosphate transporter|nr:MAG: inorganic phosphate transporter [Bacteroidetes bacterium HGW-Bacteroidetes-4]
MIWFFLSSGIFLGWSLGANDAANVFGSAVGSRMVKFRLAALVASIFVILGATFQGSGGSETLGKLGSVDAIAGSFTVAFSAAITVFWMTRLKIPVSTSQAIVGGIVGWNLYTGRTTNAQTLIEIVTTWGSGILLGAVFAILLFMLLRFLLNRVSIHLLWRDAWLRFLLLVIGAFGAYSLGANNIANVMGVFVSAVHFPELDLGLFTLSGEQQLFFLGGLAISLGIITYSKKVMQTVGENIMPLRGETAMVVVLAQALVLFVLSSQHLSDAFQAIGLPRIPLVPVSSSQVIIGAILGIGLLKGVQNMRFNILGTISLGWLATPLITGVIAFFSLFFVSNVFKLEVQQPQAGTEKPVVLVLSDSLPVLLKTADSVMHNDSILLDLPASKVDVENTGNNSIPIVVLFMVIGILVLMASAITFLFIRQKSINHNLMEIKAQLNEWMENEGGINTKRFQ